MSPQARAERCQTRLGGLTCQKTSRLCSGKLLFLLEGQQCGKDCSPVGQRDRTRLDKGWSCRQFEVILSRSARRVRKREDPAAACSLGIADSEFCAEQLKLPSPTSANLEHLISYPPPTPPPHPRGLTRSRHAWTLGSLSSRAGTVWGRTWLFVDASSVPPWPFGARWTMEPRLLRPEEGRILEAGSGGRGSPFQKSSEPHPHPNHHLGPDLGDKPGDAQGLAWQSHPESPVPRFPLVQQRS